MARIFLVVVSLQQKQQSSYRQKGKGKVLVGIPTRMFKTEQTLIRRLLGRKANFKCPNFEVFTDVQSAYEPS